MKLLFSILLGAVMAVSVQAVTVAWTLQNSYWIAAQDGASVDETTGTLTLGEGAKISNWTGITAGTASNLDVYVFFSGSDFTAEGAAGAVTSTTTKADYATDGLNYNPGKSSTLSVIASNLNPSNDSGYYYMVIFEGNKTDSENYAVAKTTQITGSESGVAKNTQGVYNTAAGDMPDAIDYVTLEWMADSTWAAPKMTPEPTVMALLALGVAGLALRRKNV